MLHGQFYLAQIMVLTQYFIESLKLTVKTWKRASLMEPCFFGAVEPDGKSSGRAVKTAMACSTSYGKTKKKDLLISDIRSVCIIYTTSF